MDRCQRRYLNEKHFKRRLEIQKFSKYYWRSYKDVNGIKHANPKISDYLSDTFYMKFKKISTNKFDSKRKVKFSPNKSKSYYRDNKKIDTREFRRLEFFRLLRQYGLK